MTQYIAIARDLLILALLSFVAYFIWEARANKDATADLKSQVAQLQENAKKAAAWQSGVTNAQNTASDKLDQLAGALSSFSARPPIIVRVPAEGSGVPSTATATGGKPADSGPVSAGQQPAMQPVDIRPMWDAYIAKYGQALIRGQQCYDSWPH